MKLSSREKILMIALVMAGLLAAYYYFLLSPQLVVLEKVKVQAAEDRAKVEEMKAQMNPNHPIYAELKTKQAELTQKTARLYPAMLQDKLITILNEKLRAAGLDPDIISFKKTLAFAEDAKKKSTAKKTDKALIDLMVLKQKYMIIDNPEKANEKIPETLLMQEMNTGINIVSDYQKLMSFITAIEKDKYKIMLDFISMETTENNTLESTIGVTFISVPKLFEELDKDYLDWLLEYKSGKYNPFLASANLNEGEVAPTPVVTTPAPGTPTTPTTTPKPATPTTTTPKPTTPAATPAPSKSSDFAITLRPISSDVPTVLVGRVNDRGAGAYVYADNPDFENVEVQILESDGKLYYRYRTTSDNYPSNYSEMTEFKPKTSGVIIEVISSKRTGSDDTSGINLTVINKSGKKVTVSIKNDDASRSRVKIKSTSGSVTVSR